MTDMIKRTVRVTMTKEVNICLPANFDTPEYLDEFRRGLWHVDSIEDVFKYAARVAAYYDRRGVHDGLGVLDTEGSVWPSVPDCTFKVTYDESEEEVIQS